MARRKGSSGQGSPPRPPRTPKTTASSQAFDVWLDHSRHEIYDDVTKEPLPEELLKLLKEDRKP